MLTQPAMLGLLVRHNQPPPTENEASRFGETVNKLSPPQLAAIVARQ